MNSNPKAVDFLGYEIALIEDDDGKMYVPLKRVCEILGIDYKSQVKSVKRYGIYDEKVLPVLSENGRYRKMPCLSVKRMRSWMRGVNHSKVRPDMVERLFEWRDEFDTAMDHLVNYGIFINARVPAEQLQAANREFLEKKMKEILAHLPEQQKQYELLQTELSLLDKVPYESRRYYDKVRECMTIAIDKHEEWLANFEKSNSPDPGSLEKMDELRNLEKDYRDLHSVKDDLFELCGRLKDKEPELCDQLWQFCCRVHERCESNVRVIIDLKKELGYPPYWQVPSTTVELAAGSGKQAQGQDIE
jgi:P22_AR N-terminal domain